MSNKQSISFVYNITASVDDVWRAFTDAELAEKWGAGHAKVNPQVGGEFSYWDGDIHGVFTKLVKNELIEQDWYGHDNPDRKFKAVFTFEPSPDGSTTIQFEHHGEHEDPEKDVREWREYYFDPIKKLLEGDANKEQV